MSSATTKLMYSFPELKNNEILQCMEDLKIPISEADLLKPSAFVVQRIFHLLTEIFVNVDARNTKFYDLSDESLQESINLIYLCQKTYLSYFYIVRTKLMKSVGIGDFGMSDFVRPDYNRLRLILSAIINFAKFREEQLIAFETLSKNSLYICDRFSELQSKEAEMSSKIFAIE